MNSVPPGSVQLTPPAPGSGGCPAGASLSGGVAGVNNTTIQTSYCWAIATDATETKFIGRFYFSHVVPPHLGGLTTATWATRKDARAALWLRVRPQGYSAFPEARVVRVKVMVIPVW